MNNENNNNYDNRILELMNIAAFFYIFLKQLLLGMTEDAAFIMTVVYLIVILLIRFLLDLQSNNIKKVYIVLFYFFITFCAVKCNLMIDEIIHLQILGIIIVAITNCYICILYSIFIYTLLLHASLLYFGLSNANNLTFLIFYIFVFFFSIVIRKYITLFINRIEELSTKDDFTDLLNQRGFLDRLEDEFYRSSRYEKKFSLLMIDSDGLKSVNDTYGHKYGSIVITSLAEIIKNNIRRTDFAGRYGGDEFIVCLVETTLESSLEVAERIRKMVESKLIYTDKGKRISVSVSIGVSSFPEGGDKLNDIMENSDKALYLAKNEGKNRVKFLLNN